MRRARAFGIDIETPRPLPALAAVDRAEGDTTRVVLAGTGATPDGDWPHTEAVLIEDSSDAGGVAIETHPDMGFRIREPTGDTYRVSLDGLEVRCSFASLDAWWHQRFLCSRVLPLAATVRGSELLHAGCVGIDDRGIAFVGPSFAGKSSLTLQMVLRGASFVTDDLLAVEVGDGPPSAHPGLALAGIRHAERDLMPEGELARLRPVIDEGGKVWVAPSRAAGALPLAVIYLLVRDADAGELDFEHLPDPDPRLLLSASFFSRLEVSPERLTNHLFVSAALARSVPVVRTVIPQNVGAAELAGRILARESAASRRTHAA